MADIIDLDAARSNTENNIADAEVVNQEVDQVVPKNGRAYIIVRKVDPNNTSETRGMQFMLNEKGEFAPEQVDAFVRSMSLAQIIPNKSMAITAKLMNGETVESLYNPGVLDKYDQETGINTCTAEIRKHIWDFFQSLYATANYSEADLQRDLEAEQAFMKSQEIPEDGE